MSVAPDTGYWFVVGAFGAALLASAFLAFFPAVTTVTETAEVTAEVDDATDDPGRDETSVREDPVRTEETIVRETLPESRGWGVVAGLGGPLVALTGLPLLVRSRRASIVVRWTATVLLWAFTVLGALSFGILYLVPALLMLGGAALALERRRTEERGGADG